MLILVLLSCLLIQVAAVELAVSQGKISTELKTALQNLDSSETTLAYVKMQDVDHDAVMDEFASRYPEEYNIYMTAKFGDFSGETTESEEALLQSAIELKRAIYREFYASQNQNVLAKCSDPEKLTYMSEYAPIAIVEIDGSDAIKMSLCDDVLSISEYVESRVHSDASNLLPGLTSAEIVLQLDLSNQISRSDILRDTKNLTGSGIKIGILESSGVPDTTDIFLQNANITIRPGDERAHHHATTIALILAAESPDGTKHGIVPDAHFYCTSVFVSSSSAVPSAIYSDIEWMISQGVNIINGSFYYGYEEDYGTYDPLSQWIDHIATVHDVHFVTTSGNDYDFITPPGMAYNAYTVGSYRTNGSVDVADFTMYENSCFEERDGTRPEKPNLVANGYFGNWLNNGVVEDYAGTSFAAPQVTGTIAQLCCWNGNLKYRQNVVGAVLAASAAEKVDAVGDGYQGDFFISHIDGSEQINDVEGAGILDARWAWGILANHNYWNLKLEADDFPYEKTVTINTNVHTLSRVAIFWTKNNTDFDHATNTLGNNNPPLPNLDLFIFDSEGNLIASSNTSYSNFEIVQFVPCSPGIYTIRITGSTNALEYVGLALW